MSFKTYYPEMNEAKPEADGMAQIAHYGKHYYVHTHLKLKGQGIIHTETATAASLAPSAHHRIGEYTYRVTLAAFHKLCKIYNFSGEILLD